MEYFNAFWVGGLVCVLVQILIENTKLMPGRIMVILVVTGTFLGAFGLFPYLKEYAGAGIWQQSVGRRKKSRGRRRLFRVIQGRIYGSGYRNFIGADFFLYRQSDLSA